MFTMLAEKKNGEWLVIEAQNTNFMDGPNPELNGISPPIAFPEAAQTP
jgi:hypothetical protein